MKTKFSRSVYAISDRIWCNKHLRHTTMEKYDNNRKGGYQNRMPCSCYWSNSQIPECTCSISYNAPFRTEMCTFLFWMEHCGIWNRCILGFVKLVYCRMMMNVYMITLPTPVSLYFQNLPVRQFFHIAFRKNVEIGGLLNHCSHVSVLVQCVSSGVTSFLH